MFLEETYLVSEAKPPMRCKIVIRQQFVTAELFFGGVM